MPTITQYAEVPDNLTGEESLVAVQDVSKKYVDDAIFAALNP